MGLEHVFSYDKDGDCYIATAFGYKIIIMVDKREFEKSLERYNTHGDIPIYSNAKVVINAMELDKLLGTVIKPVSQNGTYDINKYCYVDGGEYIIFDNVVVIIGVDKDSAIENYVLFDKARRNAKLTGDIFLDFVHVFERDEIL